MLWNFPPHIWHASVTELDGIFVTNLVKLVSWRETFFQNCKEFGPNVGFDIVWPGGVQPNDFSVSIPIVSLICIPCIRIKSKLMFIKWTTSGEPPVGLKTHQGPKLCLSEVILFITLLSRSCIYVVIQNA